MFLLAMSMMIALPVFSKKVKWTEEMKQTLKEMQDMSFWQCGLSWLEDHDRAESYVKNLSRYSITSLKNTRKHVVEEQNRVQMPKMVIDAICGKKKGEKRQAALAEYFTDMTCANRVIEKAERIYEDASMLIGAIDYEIEHREPAVMPEGRLLSFFSSAGNGFAGWRRELALERDKGSDSGTLTLREERHVRWGPKENANTDTTIVVDDSVFQRVRDMVESGMLYEIGKDYYPDFDITDASSWSLSIYFEKGDISSGGYATSPDHSDALSEIERYLAGMFKKENEDTSE